MCFLAWGTSKLFSRKQGNRSLQDSQDSIKPGESRALWELAAAPLQAGTDAKMVPMPKDAASRGIKAPLPPHLHPHYPSFQYYRATVGISKRTTVNPNTIQETHSMPRQKTEEYPLYPEAKGRSPTLPNLILQVSWCPQHSFSCVKLPLQEVPSVSSCRGSQVPEEVFALLIFPTHTPSF